MVDKSVYDEDWGDVEKETKSAASKGGTFIQLKDDGDEVFVAFIQKAETREVMTDRWGLQTRTKANVAVFEKNGEEYAGVKILELAPTHWGPFLDYRREYGGDSIFKIRRKGPAGNKDTKYNPFFVRKLKEDEKDAITAAELHDLWTDRSGEDNDGYPGSYAPEVLDRNQFAQACLAEMQRLGWKKQDYIVANRTFLGSEFKEFADMTPINRENLLMAIRAMKKGQEPGAIGYESLPPDLSEDIDFI